MHEHLGQGGGTASRLLNLRRLRRHHHHHHHYLLVASLSFLTAKDTSTALMYCNYPSHEQYYSFKD